MKRKWLLRFLMVAMLAISIIAMNGVALAETSATLNYKESFNVQLPHGFGSLKNASTDNMYIQDDAVVIDSSSGQWLDTQMHLPIDEITGSDYKIELDFKITNSFGNDLSKWIGVMYRVQDGNKFHRMIVRRNALTHNTGVEFGRYAGAATTIKGTKFTSDLTDSDTYNIKIYAVGGQVRHYLNNTPIILDGDDGYVGTLNTTGTGYDNPTFGYIGLQASACRAEFSNIKVTALSALPSDSDNVETLADGATYYELDLPNADYNIPAGYETMLTTKPANAYIDNQQLVLNALNETDAQSVALPAEIGEHSDYSISMSVTFEDANNANDAHLGVFLRMNSNYTKYHEVQIFQNAKTRSGGGVVLNNLSSKLSSASYVEDLPTDTAYMVKIYVLGGRVQVWLEDEILLSTDCASTIEASGLVGIKAAKAKLIIDDIAIDTITDFPPSKVLEGTIYTQNFDETAENELPEGFYRLTGSQQGAIGVKGGALVVDGTVHDTSMTSISLPDHLQVYNNYKITFDFTILAANNTGRWVGFMYRANSNFSKYYQLCVRQAAATNSSGVEFSNLANSWTVVERTQYSEDIDPAKTYKAEIYVVGNEVKQYLDGRLLIHGELEAGHEKGGFGIQAAGAKAQIDNIVIEVASELPSEQIKQPVYKTTYQVDTKIALPPVVSANVSSADKLNALDAEKQAAVAVLRVNADLDVVTASGTVIDTLEAALEKLGDTIIPAFYVSNQAAADALADYCVDNAIQDGAVISSNAALVKSVRETAIHLRGMIDFSSSTLPANKAIQSTVNSNHAKVAILSKQQATVSVIDYLQRRLVNVWVIDCDSKTDIYNTVLKGVDGIISNDFSGVINALESFTDTTLIRMSYVVGHRGMPDGGNHLENSLSSAIAAYEAGADAIENDIWLTKDNKVVIMHDESLARTSNGTGNVEDYTLAELKQLYLKEGTQVSTERIPTLAEFFEEFKEKPVMHFIEIKSKKAGIAQIVKDLIAEYDVSEQIVFISFDAGQLNAFRKIMPEYSYGLLSDVGGANAAAVVKNCINLLNPGNFTFHPSYASINAEVVSMLRERSINTYPWTYRLQDKFFEHYELGYYGLTTDMAWWASEFMVSLETESVYEVYTDASKSVLIAGTVYDKLGNDLGVEVEIIIIDGDNIGLKENDNGFYATNTGEAKAILRFNYKNDDSVGLDYYLYSQVVTIKATAAPTDDGCAGCGSEIGFNAETAIFAGVFIALGLVCVFLLKRKKSNKA